MTRSPFFNVLIKGVLLRYCSATSGDTFALIPPVPRPIMMMATMYPGNDAPEAIAIGMDVQTRMIKPTR